MLSYSVSPAPAVWGVIPDIQETFTGDWRPSEQVGGHRSSHPDCPNVDAIEPGLMGWSETFYQFKPQFCHCLAVQPWANGLIFLNLNCFTPKIRMISPPASKNNVRVKGDPALHVAGAQQMVVMVGSSSCFTLDTHPLRTIHTRVHTQHECALTQATLGSQWPPLTCLGQLLLSPFV